VLILLVAAAAELVAMELCQEALVAMVVEVLLRHRQVIHQVQIWVDPLEYQIVEEGAEQHLDQILHQQFLELQQVVTVVPEYSLLDIRGNIYGNKIT
jgi:flagellar biosynthesis/type III secretory pathway protein FliH